MKNGAFSTRRDFMQGCMSVAAPALLRGQSPQKPMNIVLVICDQMRGDALGFVGSPNARTPELDRLAARGVSFDNHFSNSPVCMPSRKSVFSGLYPHQHGSLTNTPSKPMDLPATLIAHFRDRGYRIGYIGKNHCYRDKVLSSLDTVSIRDREPFRQYNEFVPPEWHCDTYWPAEECFAWRSTNEALQFLDSARGTPFFLTVSYFDPHPPYMAPSEFTSRYNGEQMKIPPYIPPSALSGRLDDFCRAMKFHKINDTDLTETMRYYFASIEGMVDYQVGRIMARLQKQELIQNTIVVFTSDHGDFMGHHRAVRKGMFLYDALIHVPMIWYVPGLSRPGRRTKVLSQGIDIFPTLVDLTGGTPPPDLPGRSMQPVLAGDEADRRDAIFTSAAYGELPRELVESNQLRSNIKKVPLHTLVEDGSDVPDHRMSMLRTREWKFILNESRPPELYHMGGGCVEQENVAERAEFGGIRRVFEKRLQVWWRW